MAIDTQIDALLDSAATQGVAIDQVLQQIFLRNQSETIPDALTGIGFSDYMGSGNWPTLQAYLADYTEIMPVDIAYARAWSAYVVLDQPLFLQCLLQLLRCFARDFQYNALYPSYATKTKILSGTATLTFS